MKIGIVTFHYAHNFGALLQTYALQTKLQQMGHEVYIINYIVPRIYENYSLLSIDRKNKSFLKKIKARIIKIITIPLRYKKYIKFKNFIKSNFRVTCTNHARINLIFLKNNQIFFANNHMHILNTTTITSFSFISHR